LGAVVTDAALCRNETIRHETAPRFDAVFFASASAAEAFESAWGLAPLEGRVVVTIGRPTAEALRSRGRAPEVVSDVESADGAIAALARFVFSRGA
jgi:uroporphyrinogen-III synthase